MGFDPKVGNWVQLALKSGTVTPNAGFTGYPDGFEAEFTDKPHPQSAEGA
nr:hypothetical protein [Natronosalvus vescus]